MYLIMAYKGGGKIIQMNITGENIVQVYASRKMQPISLIYNAGTEKLYW